MKKVEKVAVKTEDQTTYYCDICSEKIDRIIESNWGDSPANKLSDLENIAATKVFGYTQIYCRPEFVRANDDLYPMGNPSKEENKAVWERIKLKYPTYEYDCCYECFSSVVVPFLESKKLTK